MPLSEDERITKFWVNNVGVHGGDSQHPLFLEYILRSLVTLSLNVCKYIKYKVNEITDWYCSKFNANNFKISSVSYLTG